MTQEEIIYQTIETELWNALQALQDGELNYVRSCCGRARESAVDLHRERRRNNVSDED